MIWKSHGGICYDGKVTQYNIAGPYFAIQDTDAVPLCYFEDYSVAAEYKEINGFKSIYVSTCNFPSALLRNIAHLADIFVYSEYPHVYVYPNSACVGVYNAKDHSAKIHMPQDGAYRDLRHNGICECKNGLLSIPKDEINAFLLIKEIL